MRPMLRPLPPSVAARGGRVPGTRLTEMPTRARTRARGQRLRRLVVRAVAVVVVAFSACMVTARTIHEVGRDHAAPVAGGAMAVSPTVSAGR